MFFNNAKQDAYLQKVSCANCGGNQLEEISDGVLVCPYCNTQYMIRKDNKGRLKDAVIDGINIADNSVYYVTETLDVDGVNIEINKFKNSNRDVVYVRNLEVIGVGNRANVILPYGMSQVKINGVNCRISDK